MNSTLFIKLSSIKQPFIILFILLILLILLLTLTISGCWQGFGGVMAPNDTARAITAGADTDPDANEVSLLVSISHAADESSIDQYILYWGSSPSAKISSAIISFPAQGADICYTIPENTVLPTGASFLLVITANKYGEKTSGAYCSIS
ncbi:MAG: hypothetical protein GY754_04590, partial [bacterium]|nr:hypothetical protein [bacterium]